MRAWVKAKAGRSELSFSKLHALNDGRVPFASVYPACAAPLHFMPLNPTSVMASIFCCFQAAEHCAGRPTFRLMEGELLTCEETQTVRRCLLASSKGMPTVSTTWLSASLSRNFVVPSFDFTCRTGPVLRMQWERSVWRATPAQHANRQGQKSSQAVSEAVLRKTHLSVNHASPTKDALLC